MTQRGHFAVSFAMAATPPSQPPSDSGGFQIGDVDGDLNVTVGRDWVGRDKIVNITRTTTIQISVEAVTQKPLVTVSPYRGLDRFEDRDKDLFFGRDQLIQSLLAQINGTNITLVLGGSGSGKSSVVRAGVLPRLSGELGAKFRYFALVPDVNPFESLRSALQVGGFSQAQTRELLDAQPDTSIGLIRGLQRDGDQWLIFVDQFEEIFTISDEQLRTNFISALLKMAQDSTGSIKLVLAMRSDFFDRFGRFPEFAKLIENNIKVVTDMQVDELRLAIEQPAAQHGVVFEQGLVEEIIKDVQGEAGSLPLLEYTLNLLWQEEESADGLTGRHLNTQTYRDLGGVRGALQKRADEIYASFGDGADQKNESERQKVVRQIFLRVVDLAGQDSDEEASRPVRRRVPKTNFSSPQAQEILQELIDKKLLVSSGGRDTLATVEVAHEALFTSWERLKKWIEGGQQVIFAKNRLADDARRWDSRRKEDKMGAEEELVSGSRLGQALEMRARGDFDTVFGGLSETESQFLDASAALRERRRQEEQEQAQALAEEQKKRADDQEKAAKEISKIASQGNVSLARYSKEGGQNGKALAYLARALRLDPENREATNLALAMLAQLSWHVLLSDSMRQGAKVLSAQFSPNGQRVITASADKTARLWDVASGRAIGEPMEHEDTVNSAQFSPDGQRVVTASADKTARLWDVASGRPIGEPMQHEKSVILAQFSPDGQRVVTASWDRTARLWHAATGKTIGEPMKHESMVNLAQFSPEGQWVITASVDKTARLWDGASCKPIGEPMQHEDIVNSAQFSPDGQRVVTASVDKTARLWDVASCKPIGEPMQHDEMVNSAEFSPDGQLVVTASDDKTARLWDAASGKPIGQPMEHEKRVNFAQFSPDGQLVVTASWDKTARLWDAANGKPIGEPIQHEARVVSAQFSPDGQLVVTASWDKTARLWDASSGKATGEPMCHETLVNSAQFSPDGQRMVTASFDKTARVWDAISGKAIGQPMKHGDVVNSAQFSPDGQRVVTASADKTARLWDAASGKPIGEPMEHEKSTNSAQFSPDGQRMVTASWDTVRLWDAATAKPIGEPMQHETRVNSAQFSPDGQRMVTASWNTVRLWDAATGKLIGQPMKHVDVVNFAQFSPDGQRVVTASGDTTRLWDLASRKTIGEPMQHDEIVNSVQFSPDGERVVTASGDTARLWDTGSGKPVGEPMQHEEIINSAQFSPDGQRVVTASWDKSARLWDAASGKPVSEPMEHEKRVMSARFSPDGQRVVTASANTARLWDLLAAKPKDEKEELMLLSALSETMGGFTLESAERGENLTTLQSEPIDTIRKKIAAKRTGPPSELSPLQGFLKWSVADRGSRTISPFSQITVVEWLENRIKEGTIEGLRAALQVDPANTRVTAHLGRRLLDYALRQDHDPDDARRAVGEANFLTARALKLAPKDSEVKELRDQVVKLLETRTEGDPFRKPLGDLPSQRNLQSKEQ